MNPFAAVVIGGARRVKADLVYVLCYSDSFTIENVRMHAKYFLPMRQSLFYFSGAGKLCLAHGLRQLTRDTKSDVIC